MGTFYIKGSIRHTGEGVNVYKNSAVHIGLIHALGRRSISPRRRKLQAKQRRLKTLLIMPNIQDGHVIRARNPCAFTFLSLSVYSSKITHIATQGMFDPPQNANGNNVENWVKEYEVQYSIDGEHFISYDVRGKVQVIYILHLNF